MFTDNSPCILIGAPDRVIGLMREIDLKLDRLTQIVLDVCDKCLDELDVRNTGQHLFIETRKQNQVMMCSAALGTEFRASRQKFLQVSHEIRVGVVPRLILHGLLLYYVNLSEREKNYKLNDRLDVLVFQSGGAPCGAHTAGGRSGQRVG